MALLTTVNLTDDFDGSDVGVKEHTFCLDGVTYEIDLTVANHERLTAALTPFIAAGRRLPARKAPHRTRRRAEAETSGHASEDSHGSRKRASATAPAVVPVVFAAPSARCRGSAPTPAPPRPTVPRSERSDAVGRGCLHAAARRHAATAFAPTVSGTAAQPRAAYHTTFRKEPARHDRVLHLPALRAARRRPAATPVDGGSAIR
ncbi:Lsr2 dimerization domain-containing protein [Phytohabitans aurantiacus]|uniref:Lsr2 dimerization domain-containing protein n=1 Tax=Phytohabitans aurantiacus TaxID=3016789 RepID=A0ABQ5R3Y5_9ACTN|nr:hypothetical protein Pa4123_59410 [Phytohabitans aurantiacus]